MKETIIIILVAIIGLGIIFLRLGYCYKYIFKPVSETPTFCVMK